jgi:hypothetical protein
MVEGVYCAGDVSLGLAVFEARTFTTIHPFTRITTFGVRIRRDSERRCANFVGMARWKVYLRWTKILHIRISHSDQNPGKRMAAGEVVVPLALARHTPNQITREKQLRVREEETFP